MKKLAIMCGLPGCGKSDLTRRLVNCWNGFAVCPDSIRTMLNAEYLYVESLEPMVFEISKKTVCSICRDFPLSSVIYDEVNKTVKERRVIIKDFCSCYKFEPVIIYFPLDVELCLQRRRIDNRGYSSNRWSSVIRDFASKFEAPTEEECRVVTVDENFKLEDV